MDKKSVRAVLLILSTLTYLLIGAAVFEKLEAGDDVELREQIAFISNTMQNKYNFSKMDYDLLQAVVIKSIPQKAGFQWKFAGAFYFATVVITTVGYGHSTPETTFGKLFCMMFALAGIPLGLVMFQSIGERVNTAIAYCLRKLRSMLVHRGVTVISEITPTHLLIVSLSIGTMVIAIGTYVFHRVERWTLFDSYYYCFISLSTIGFGDYVPLQTDGVLQKDHAYVVFTLLFIVGGLAFFSASVNLLVLGFMAPNADAVTAASREPPRAIVFETFTRTGSASHTDLPLVASDTSLSEMGNNVGNNANSSMNDDFDSRGRMRYSLDDFFGNEATFTSSNRRGGLLRRICLCGCDCADCRESRQHAYFSIRRNPTANIAHLVNYPVRGTTI